MTDFYTKLNDLIEQSGFSKNQIIHASGIDRSTFFRILKKERSATEEQFGRLLKVLNGSGAGLHISQADMDILLDLYMRTRLDQVQYENWCNVRSFIHSANTECERSEVELDPTEEILTAFLQKRLSNGDQQLDFYLSPELVNRFRLDSIFLFSKHQYKEIRQIISAYDDRRNTSVAVELKSLTRFLKISGKGMKVAAYTSADSLIGKNNELFPYYFISDSGLLLISQDGRECYEVKDSALAKVYRRQFEKTVRNLKPTAVSLNYLFFARNFLAMQQNIGDGKLYGIVQRPCFWQLVTDDIIRKHVHDLGYSAAVGIFGVMYAHCLQGLKQCCIMTSENGLKSFEKDHLITENGLNVRLDEEDMEQLNGNLRKIMNRQLYTVPFSDSIINDWEIILYPDEMILNYYHNMNCLIRIEDKEIIHAFTDYYQRVNCKTKS